MEISQKEAQMLIELINRSPIKGSEAETVTMLKSKLSQPLEVKPVEEKK